MTDSIRVVFLGPDELSGDSSVTRIGRQSDLLILEHESTVEAGLAKIDSGDVECVLADETFVRDDDRAVLDCVNALDSQLPVLAVVRDDGEDRPDGRLEAGVTDVVGLTGDGVSSSVHATRIENAALRYRASTGPDGDRQDRTDVTGCEPGDPATVERAEYERLFEELGQSIFATDETGNYTYVNPAGAEITGYEPAEILDGGLPLLFPEKSQRERLYEAFSTVASTEDRGVVTVEAALETKAGERVPVEITMTRRTDEEGGFQGVVGIVRDVTEEREAEQRLRENEAIMRAIPDELVVLDTDGYLTRVIPSTNAEITASGYTPAELDGMHVSAVMDDDSFGQAADRIAEMITSDRQRATTEMQIVTRDDERLWRESHFTLLENEAGDIQGSVGLLRDIEERKAYEQELERQNDRLAEFASITTHDLRNPLNIAQGYLEMVGDECDSEHVPAVEDALDRMERLIDDTLAWARQGSSVTERRPVDLASLADECWEAVGSDDGTLTVETSPTVHGDADRIRRVLENLLRNAVEHAGDDVSVRIGTLPDGFYVADDGPGVPPEQRNSVFEAGFTTDSEGTGFGLAVVGEVVEAHGWEITVTESDAGGARFEITGVDSPS